MLTWNLMHGRSLPGAGRDLFEEFSGALAAWQWDVALLQEVPPWWPAALGARLQASARMVLTSRNELPALRRAVANRWPDAIESNGGGANSILVRDSAIASHRRLRLAGLPERRWLQAVWLPSVCVWVGNLHATVRNERAAVSEARRAAAQMLAWSQGAPALLGGDFNVRALEHGALSDHAPVRWEIS